MKINKEKISLEANKVLMNINTTKEAVTLILLGAGINEYGAKIVEQKFNNAQESLNTFLNMVVAEIRNSEPKQKEDWE
jgi:hypothetical protein